MEFDIESTRSLFEEKHIGYRQFMTKNHDGSYAHEWVEELWRGWQMAHMLPKRTPARWYAMAVCRNNAGQALCQ